MSVPKLQARNMKERIVKSFFFLELKDILLNLRPKYLGRKIEWIT